MGESDDDGAMLSLEQAAILLGYSVIGLRKLVGRRVIRYFQSRPHAPVKFRREWIDEYIDAHSIEPGAPLVTPAQRKRKAPPLPAGAFWSNTMLA